MASEFCVSVIYRLGSPIFTNEGNCIMYISMSEEIYMGTMLLVVISEYSKVVMLKVKGDISSNKTKGLYLASRIQLVAFLF